ncbi:MAG: hypothetical protein AAFU85_05400 [Planctomycetota bacterium]
MANLVDQEVTVEDSEKTAFQEERELERQALKVSRFDSVTSFFFALIMFLGAFVTMMFIIWLLSGEPKPAPLDILIEEPEGRADNPEGFERDFEPPSNEEIEELLEPTIEDTIQAVTDAVSTVAATVSNLSADNPVSGDGKGDNRPPGPEGNDDVIPRSERWEMKFNARGKKDYATQLDFYKIELAAFGGGGANVIESASNLASSPRRKVNNKPETEKRLYFSWKLSNPLIQFDRALLSAAGISYSGRNVIRFVPADLENLLANIEKDYCEKKKKTWPGSIAKTVFESVRGDNGFEFQVVSQRYRPGR